MALVQSAKSKKVVAVETSTSNWSSVFPAEIKTEQKSLLFVKKLLAVGISTLTYLRNIFPEKAYADKCCEGLNLKMLVNSSDCPGVPNFVEWIMGAFDAIQHKYLRQLTLAFSKSENPDASVLETYSFSFLYSSDGSVSINNITSPAMHKLQGRVSLPGSSKERHKELKKATLKMLRSIIVLTQSLDQLPRDVYLSMRLRYYDAVTPPDYEPPGFTSCDQTSYVFSGLVVALGMGDVRTGHHSVSLRLKTRDCHFAEEHSHLKLKDDNSSQDSTALSEAPNTSARLHAGNPNATSTPMKSTCSSISSAAAAGFTTDDTGTKCLYENKTIDVRGANHDNDGGARSNAGDSNNVSAGGTYSAGEARTTAVAEEAVSSTVTNDELCEQLEVTENHGATANNKWGSVVEVSSDASFTAPATQEIESVVIMDGNNFRRSARFQRSNRAMFASPPLVVPGTNGSGQPEEFDTQEQTVPTVYSSATKIISQTDTNGTPPTASFEHPSANVEALRSTFSNVIIDLEPAGQTHSGTFPGEKTSSSTPATSNAFHPDPATQDPNSTATLNVVNEVTIIDPMTERRDVERTPVLVQEDLNDGDVTPLLVAKDCIEVKSALDNPSTDMESDAQHLSHHSESPLMYKLGSTLCRTPVQRAPGSAGSGASQCSMRSVSVALAPTCPSPGYPVRCACQVHADDGLMVLCDVCGYWQHGACFGILRVEDAPERHLCHLCSDPPTLCSDPRLCFLSPLTMEETCLFRRSLSVLRNGDNNANTEFSSMALAQRLGCNITRATVVVDKLLDAGVLHESECGARKRKRKLVVKLDVLENDAVPKFFTKQASQPTETEEPQASNQSSQEWAPQPKKRKCSLSSTAVKKCPATTP